MKNTSVIIWTFALLMLTVLLAWQFPSEDQQLRSARIAVSKAAHSCTNIEDLNRALAILLKK